MTHLKQQQHNQQNRKTSLRNSAKDRKTLKDGPKSASLFSAELTSAVRDLAEFTVVAPPGPLGLVLEENFPGRPKGVYVTTVRETSPLYGQVNPGSMLLDFDGIDVTNVTIDQVDKLMKEEGDQARVLKFKHRPRTVRRTSLTGDKAEERQKARMVKFLANKNPVKDIIIYLVFMSFFTVSTLRGLLDTDIFYFGANLKGQFTGVEFLEAHSPSVGKTFEDIGTVEEFNQWLMGPFVASAFSSHTFDGDPEWGFQGGKPGGYALGYGKILGAIRISQLRAEPKGCNDQVPPTLVKSHNWTCYGSSSMGFFDPALEAVDAYGMYSEWEETMGDHGDIAVDKVRDIGEFKYNGMTSYGKPLNSSVAEARAMYLSSFTTRRWNTYPAPAFGITMYPGMGEAQANKVVRNIVHSNYIDLQTKAVFVDLTVYNAMIDRICSIRLVAEMTKAGGVLPTHEFEVLRLWEYVTQEDFFFVGILVIVALFYVFYFLEALQEYRMLGIQYLKSFLNMMQILNFVFFLIHLCLSVYAVTILPEDVPVDSETFIEFLPSVRFKNSGTAVQAINVFLNWFKLIAILSYAPTFGVMTDTLAKAAEGVAGFGVIFFIVFFGFAQAHTMVFHGRLEDFRTISQSIFALLRSLLGDFDFLSLQDAHVHMGPLFFIIFVSLAMFVVLNMLVAIISDAYITCQEEMRQKKQVNLLAEIKEYLLDLPGIKKCGKICGAITRFVLRRKKKIHVEAYGKKAKALEVKKAQEELAAEEARKKAEEAAAKGEEGGDEEEKSEEPQSSSSSYILEEWYKNLRTQDVEFQRLKSELRKAKQDVTEMRDEFKEAIEMMITQIMTKVYKDRDDKIKQAQKQTIPAMKMLKTIAFDQAAPSAPAKPAASSPAVQQAAAAGEVASANEEDEAPPPL
jgi:hypothetical protein